MGRRYRKILSNKTDTGITYKKNVIYPDIPLHENDTYVITQSGDRYDILAQEFYNDPHLWWIISTANNYQKGSLNIVPGVQMRIPSDKTTAIKLFEELNKNR